MGCQTFRGTWAFKISRGKTVGSGFANKSGQEPFYSQPLENFVSDIDDELAQAH
jgi:hypothetical protein